MTKNTKVAKIISGEFIGFYDKVFHKIKADEINYISIDDEKWNYLMNEEAKGGDIIFSEDKELKIYHKPIKTIEGADVKFNYKTEQWEETATLQKQVDYWYEEIKKISKEIAIATIDDMVNPESLQKKLIELKLKHNNLSHELAKEINLNK